MNKYKIKLCLAIIWSLLLVVTPSVIEVILRLKVPNRLLDAKLNGEGGFPAQNFLRPPDVRLSLLRIVGHRRELDDQRGCFRLLLDVGGKVLDRVLFRVANVDRQMIVAFHQGDHSGDEIVHKLERAGLFPVSIYREVLPLDGLGDKVADNTPVIGEHARPIGVEDAHHPDLNILLVVVRVCQSLRNTLSLVVARPRANGIHMSPVGLALRVLLGIAINLCTKAHS